MSAATVRSLWGNPTKFISGLQGETCRDVSHMVMGFESMAYAAETARIQGVDLYGEFETRFIAALELNASYINAFLDEDGEPTPSNWACASALNEGGSAYKLGWEIAYNHYAQRGGKSLPEVAALIERFRPTGTGLHINWETLTHAGTP